jgi:hypothetical protein
MITVEEAMHELYSTCCTQPYRARSHCTVSAYTNAPLLEAEPGEFKTEVLLGPAAKAYTHGILLPK